MKKFVLPILLMLFLFPLRASATTISFFYGEGCPHCAKEKTFLKELQEEYPDIKIDYYETWYNEENSDLLKKVKESFSEYHSYVPYTVIGNKTWTGYQETVESEIRSYIKACQYKECTDIVEKVKETGESVTIQQDTSRETVTLPVFGTFSVKKVTVPLLAVLMGFLDGFNPCAMWVLLFLISMLLGMKDRKKMWLLGSTFIAGSGFIYFLFLTSWLKLATTVNQLIILRICLGGFAALFGIYELVTALRKKEVGCTVTNQKQRKKIMGLIKRYLHEQSFVLACIGILFVSFLVNLIEFACSAGFPVLFTQILSMLNFNQAESLGLILIYILFYLIDDIIVFVISMKTLKAFGISNKWQKYTKLISGILLIVVALYLIFQ